MLSFLLLFNVLLWACAVLLVLLAGLIPILDEDTAVPQLTPPPTSSRVVSVPEQLQPIVLGDLSATHPLQPQPVNVIQASSFLQSCASSSLQLHVHPSGRSSDVPPSTRTCNLYFPSSCRCLKQFMLARPLL